MESVPSARLLRQQMTPAEQALWQYLRNRHLRGLKFRRQFPVGQFIADLACPEHRLIVEVDGGIHNDQVDQDAAHTEILAQFGWRVLRFPNVEVLLDPATVLERIAREAEQRSK
jgi:very-short-patch-repair endonuclease